MNTTTEKLSFREKFCYGLGDASMNIFMGFTMMFLTIFYTDVFKLNPAVMGTLFLAVRFIDAISDPLCGMISDRTKSVRGRYRPWLLFAAIPYGVLVLLYSSVLIYQRLVEQFMLTLPIYS